MLIFYEQTWPLRNYKSCPYWNRKPRPPHRARRAHGPAASSIARSSNKPKVSTEYLRDLQAHSALLPRILPIPTRLPWSATPQLRRLRQRGAGQLQPESAIAPTASILLSNCDADPLADTPRIGWVTSLTASRPSRNLPRRRTVTASHCSALRRLRRRGQGLPSLQHNSQSQKCLTTARPGFCVAVP